MLAMENLVETIANAVTNTILPVLAEVHIIVGNITQGVAMEEDFTLPHIFQLDSRWTLVDSRWISAVHPLLFLIFSLVVTKPNAHLESSWTPVSEKSGGAL